MAITIRIISVASLVFTAFNVSAQPTVISPQDVARSAQLNTVTDDFSHTPAYDLEHPLKLAVTLQHVHLPKDGYAQIVFTINEMG